MGDGEDKLAELRDEAICVTEHVKSHLLGDDMPCPCCGTKAPIGRDQQHTRWTVECVCGWEAAGSGPPIRSN